MVLFVGLPFPVDCEHLTIKDPRKGWMFRRESLERRASLVWKATKERGAAEDLELKAAEVAAGPGFESLEMVAMVGDDLDQQINTNTKSLLSW